MKLTIKRKEWLHGEGSSKSYLLRPNDEKKCCLGILAIACGISPAALRGRRAPAELLDLPPMPEYYQWTVNLAEVRSTTAADEAMRVNDMIGVTIESEQEREQLITQIFREHGIDVQFED